MTLKTPSFWYPHHGQPNSLLSTILRPLSWLYALGRAIHVKVTTPQKAPCPVICIGNLNTGGSGKTPSALAIMALVKTHKLAKNPAFLLRGYGGTLKGPLKVEPTLHNARHVGEEALLLCRAEQTFIAQDRYNGACYAAAQGVDLLIMDDGLQNRSLEADLKLVVINGKMGFGTGLMLPAGPLREPLASGLARADGFIIIGDDQHNVITRLPTDKPYFKAKITTNKKDIPDTTKRYLAFAGLGYPQKFFDYLRDNLKLNVIETIAFQDHHPYNENDLNNLRNKAIKTNANLITTEKDALQINYISSAANLNITALPITLQFDTPADISTLLKQGAARNDN